MSSNLLKLVIAVMFVLSTGATGFLIYSANSLTSEPLELSKPTRQISSVQSEDGLEPREVNDSEAILVNLEDIYVNIGHGVSSNKTLGLKMELEIFDEEGKETFTKWKGPLKHIILETVREQDEAYLSTLAGKLYLKEQLIAHMNEFLLNAVVRDIHFNSFLIQ
jgi:flagellar basal body-associated protein FliL